MVFLITLFIVAFAQSDDNKLTVHIIPHSHNDAGWTETFEDFFKGTFTADWVENILDSVVKHLRANPDATFVYSTISFFKRWWDDQIDVTKDHVRQLVKQGRLEFVNGGWTEHDEATPYYQDMLDNMALGHKFLLENFGIRPTVGWLPDSFGHSAAIADLYPKMGFNSLFFARIEKEDKKQRKRYKGLEFLWSPEQGSRQPENFFTHIFDDHYNCKGFSFTFNRDDYSPIYDYGNFYHQSNIASAAAKYIDKMKQIAKFYQSNHILVPMGDDFSYVNADEDYRNIDLLMKYINIPQSDVTLVYSTPSKYLNALNAQNFTFPNKADDFFPYQTEKWCSWTGFYTTRPALKKFIRTSGSLLRATQNFLGHKLWKNEVNETKVEPYLNSLITLKEAMALVQHHDAVTGTARQKVVYDYEQRLNLGLHHTIDTLISLVEAEVQAKTGVAIEYEMCPLRNISICRDYENEDEMNVAILNPRYQTVSQLFNVPTNWFNAQVYDDLGNIIPSELVEYPWPYDLLPDQAKVTNRYRIYFAVTVPAMSVRNYKILRKSGNSVQRFTPCTGTACTIRSFHGEILTSSDEENTLRNRETSINFEPVLGHYNANNGDDWDSQKSGAYIFRVQKNQFVPIDWEVLRRSIMWGQVVCMLYLEYAMPPTSPHFHHAQLFTFPLVDVEDSWLHVDTFVNAIQVWDGIGKNVIAQYKTNIVNNSKFYTDMNGMGLIERKWNNVPDRSAERYGQSLTDRNYFPITSQIHINGTNFKNQKSDLSIVVDRSQGGTCRNKSGAGYLEIMVHRRLLKDDWKGLGEAIDEADPWNRDPWYRGKGGKNGLRIITSHAVLLNAIPGLARKAEDYFNEPLQAFFGKSAEHSNDKNAEFHSVPDLPAELNAHWRPIDAQTSILRIQNTSREKAIIYNIQNLLNHYGGHYNAVQLGLSENQTFEEILENKKIWNHGPQTEIKDGYFAEKPLIDETMHEKSPAGRFLFLANEVKSFLITARF